MFLSSVGLSWDSGWLVPLGLSIARSAVDSTYGLQLLGRRLTRALVGLYLLGDRLEFPLGFAQSAADLSQCGRRARPNRARQHLLIAAAIGAHRGRIRRQLGAADPRLSLHLVDQNHRNFCFG
jgi:hypothetical protein